MKERRLNDVIVIDVMGKEVIGRVRVGKMRLPPRHGF
jgi:hypothetical protein